MVLRAGQVLLGVIVIRFAAMASTRPVWASARTSRTRGCGISLDQARVGVRGDKPYPSQASGDQVGEELVPGR